MPELPEVEVTLRGIKPHIIKQKMKQVILRHKQLRLPIPAAITTELPNQLLEDIQRRGKYLLFKFTHGTLILHLGMSGRLQLLSAPLPAKKHDHVELVFSNHMHLRFTDPRRFGVVAWTHMDPMLHPLISIIGPEPLTAHFNVNYLYQRTRCKKRSIKSFIMESKVVAGVGNIYATESLFIAGIHPQKAAGKLSREQCQKLINAIKCVLRKAIKKGGTTLKDFIIPSGVPGYFRQELQVYGRDGKRCFHCHTVLKSVRIVGRSTVYCPRCQVV